MKHLLVGVAALVVGSYALPAATQTVVSYLPGLKCMSLYLSPEQMVDPSVVVPVRAEPRGSSAQIGVANSLVLVNEPPVSQGGFVQVIMPSARQGWVEARLLRPWVSAMGPGRQCRPAEMSDGLIGFAIR